jgi:hypothetical protein
MTLWKVSLMGCRFESYNPISMNVWLEQVKSRFIVDQCLSHVVLADRDLTMKGRFQSVSSVFRWLSGPNVFSVSDHFNLHLGNRCRAWVTSCSRFLPWVLEVLANATEYHVDVVVLFFIIVMRVAMITPMWFRLSRCSCLLGVHLLVVLVDLSFFSVMPDCAMDLT